MRTRRSPRNQDRLWRALGGQPPRPVVTVTLDPVLIIESILAKPGLSARTRQGFERDLKRAKHRAAIIRAKHKGE